MDDNQLAFSMIMGVIALISIATFSITYGGHLQDKQRLECIKQGNDPIKCYCAFSTAGARMCNERN